MYNVHAFIMFNLTERKWKFVQQGALLKLTLLNAEKNPRPDQEGYMQTTCNADNCRGDTQTGIRNSLSMMHVSGM